MFLHFWYTTSITIEYLTRPITKVNLNKFNQETINIDNAINDIMVPNRFQDYYAKNFHKLIKENISYISKNSDNLITKKLKKLMLLIRFVVLVRLRYDFVFYTLELYSLE